MKHFSNYLKWIQFPNSKKNSFRGNFMRKYGDHILKNIYYGDFLNPYWVDFHAVVVTSLGFYFLLKVTHNILWFSNLQMPKMHWRIYMFIKTCSSFKWGTWKNKQQISVSNMPQELSQKLHKSHKSYQICAFECEEKM